jgi:N-methylhydantoinase B/oxoprolinase/acetone carboxylase alpha subunit
MASAGTPVGHGGHLGGDGIAQQTDPVQLQPRDDRTATEGSDQEPGQGEEGGGQGEPGGANQGEADEDHVAGHVGHEHPSQAQDAHRVHHPGGGGQEQQQGGQRPMPGIGHQAAGQTVRHPAMMTELRPT